MPIDSLIHAEYNPRKSSPDEREDVKDSIINFDVPVPLIVNCAPTRKNVIVGGNLRHDIMKELGYKEVPVVFVNIPDIEKEKELNLRLNKNTGSWDWDLLGKLFEETMLQSVGFSSEEIDEAFGLSENPEVFDLQAELEKIGIKDVDIKPGDVYEVGPVRVMCGNSMNPYLLDYLKGKKKSKKNEGFGYKRDRKYLGTDVLPPDFTEKWMANVAKVQKPDFSIMIFENPKNLRTIWNEMEKHWKYRNTIVWRLPNRVSGFAAKYKFFNKHDIALLGTSGNVSLNADPEEDALLQNEYENALFATSGKPHWESYEKGKKYCPTDFIEFKSDDAKHSGQGVVFGTKPVEILIPYIKVLTKRNSLILEVFGGSGSTAVAAFMLGRRCFLMEKSPVYTAVILNRLSKLINVTPKKL